jgi:tRNA threonylcarbamoyladenosine biosynthesis protein TsaB
MIILAVDTSTRCGAVGIARDGVPLAEISLQSQENHSARLLPAIDWLLNASHLTLKEVDGYGVVTGPGSFTGLRVGLATIKGLAWAEKKPVAELDSLTVLSRALCDAADLLVPMLDARKGRVYAAVYLGRAEGLEVLSPPADVDVGDLTASLNAPALFFGDGARSYGEEIRSGMGNRARFAPAWCDLPRGSVAAVLASESIRDGRTVDITSLEPKYLRRSEAEIKKEAQKQ